MIIYNKLDNYFFVSADRKTFLGFDMTANLRDTSPLTKLLTSSGIDINIFSVYIIIIVISFFSFKQQFSEQTMMMQPMR